MADAGSGSGRRGPKGPKGPRIPQIMPTVAPTVAPTAALADTPSINTSQRGGSPSGGGGATRGGRRGASRGIWATTGGFRGDTSVPGRKLILSADAPPGSVGGSAAPSIVNIASDVQAIGVKRPAFGKQGTPIAIDVNLFEVHINKGLFYYYKVGFSPPIWNRARRMEVFKEVQRSNQLQTAVLKRGVFDCRHYYSTISFGPIIRFKVNLRGAYTVTLKYVADINTSILHQYLQGQKTINDEVLNIVGLSNVAIRMALVDKYPLHNNHSVYMREAEWKSPHNPKYAGLELWRGYFQSVRPIIGRLAVNIDISTGVVIKKTPLAVLCLQFLGERNVNHVQRLLNMQPHERDNLSRFVRGLKIFTNGREFRSRRAIKSISDKSSFAYIVKDYEGVSMSVARYYQSRGTPLRFPKLPCVEATNSRIVYPIEKCMVAAQLVTKQLEPDLCIDVLQFSRLTPQMRLQSIRNGFQFLQHGNSPYLEEFGINVNPTPIRVQGRILEPPAIEYCDKTIRPANGIWKTGKITKPVEIQGWIFISYCRPDLFTPQMATAVAKKLFEACSEVGIRFQKPQPLMMLKNPLRGDFVADINEAVNQYKASPKTDPSLVVVVHPPHAIDIYDRVKHAGDVVLGIPTLCLNGFKASQRKAYYFQSVALKINAELGGVNSHPRAADVRFLSDPENPTLILGAATIHRTPAKASFTACTGSVDLEGCRYMGLCSPQDLRQDQIVLLEAMVIRIISEFKANNPGKLPKRILYYRYDVGQYQTSTVLREEIPQIRAACQKTGLGSPKITCVTVDRQHRVRLFPVAGADRSGNAPAGTVVDSGITSPVEFDFYLQSHASLLGTSHCAHYSVLLDENLFIPDDLQSLSFALCHVYARCTSSVSIPAPVYYATLVTLRTKHRFDPKRNSNPDHPRTADEQDRPLRDSFLDLHPNTEKVMYFQ